jgi:hypothetical protein
MKSFYLNNEKTIDSVYLEMLAMAKETAHYLASSASPFQEPIMRFYASALPLVWLSGMAKHTHLVKKSSAY